jgi:hypothetical protein
MKTNKMDQVVKQINRRIGKPKPCSLTSKARPKLARLRQMLKIFR